MITNKCWIHLAYQNNLIIKPSTIPNAGLGSFSYKLPFKRYKLGRYTGRWTTNKQLERKCKGYTPPNAIWKGMKDADRCIDANWLTDGPLRYANDIRSKSKTNIGIESIARKSGQKFIPIWETLKQIKPHTGLFNFYGKHYWSNHTK